MDLEGKVAIITGSSRGIGKAIALAYAAEGARIVVTARTESPQESRVPGTIHQTVEEIRAAKGEAIALRCDVTQENQVEALIKRTLEQFGHIDILFNNAGGPLTPGPLQDITIRQWDQVLELNLRTVVLCCKAILPVMIRQKHGHIIKMSSGAAVGNNPSRVAYSTAKAALERLTLSLAEEVREHNLAVNAYRPSGIFTEAMEFSDAIGVDRSMLEPPSAVGPSTVWLAKQTASTFTGQIVSRRDFGKTWGPGS